MQRFFFIFSHFFNFISKSDPFFLDNHKSSIIIIGNKIIDQEHLPDQ